MEMFMTDLPIFEKATSMMMPLFVYLSFCKDVIELLNFYWGGKKWYFFWKILFLGKYWKID